MSAGNMERQLLEELKAILRNIEEENGDAIERDNLSSRLRAWLIAAFRDCPKVIPKDLIAKSIEILEANINNNECLEGSCQDSQMLEVGNKARIEASTHSEGVEVGGRVLGSPGEGRLEFVYKILREEYQLPRPYLAKGLVALYLAQRKANDHVPLSKIMSILSHYEQSDTTISNIKWKLFGEGKTAKQLQLELFEDSPQFVNGEKAFKLKQAVFNFIDELVSKSDDDSMSLEKELISHSINFLTSFQNKAGERPYYQFLSEAVLKEEDSKAIIIDWMDVYSFDPWLAKKIINDPDNAIDAFKDAVLEIQSKILKGLNESQKGELYSAVPLEIHIKALPNPIRPRDLKQEHIGKLIAIRGIIAGSMKDKPFLQVATYKCISCGEEIKLMQEPFRLIELLKKCPRCGSKNIKLDVMKSRKIDIQHFTIQDSPEDLVDGEQFKKVRGYVLGSQSGNIEGGEKVIIYAIVRVLEKFNTNMPAETDYILEAIHVEPLEKEGIIELTPHDIQEIKRLKQEYGNTLPDAVADSIAPHVVDNHDVKKALALAVVGAEGLWDKRTSIHVLLVGDPSTAKTDMALDLKNIAPKVVIAEGSSSSGVGLTASVRRDELTGEYMLYGGTLVTGSGGVVIIDEFPSLKREHIDHLRMAMEQGIIPVNKANISNMILKANSTIVATGNPKRGHVDRTKPILEQLDIPSPILTRFDLIFTILDHADVERDREIIRSMLKQAKTKSKGLRKIPEDVLKKYFVYAKTRMFPKFTEEAERGIEEAFIKIRQYTGKGDKAPISRRFGDTLIRLSYAHAKLRLSDKVDAVDVENALKILENMLKTVAIDPETGEIDYRIIEAGVSSRTVELMDNVLFVVRKYEEQSEWGAPIKEVKKELRESWGISEDLVNEAIERLMVDGKVYEPYNGYLRAET